MSAQRDTPGNEEKARFITAMSRLARTGFLLVGLRGFEPLAPPREHMLLGGPDVLS